MENSIRKSNKIPGSERLTRPEEISALSKYLKEIHKIQDEHTEFTEDILEVPGRTTGKLPNIDSLSDHSEKIQKYEDKIERLPEDILKLKDSREINLLTNKTTIEDGREELSLSNEKLILDDSRDNNLSDIIEKLEDPREISLETTRLNIDDKQEAPLDNTRLNIEDTREINLSETKVNIEDKNENILDNTRINIQNKKEDVNLSNTKLNINDSRNIDLESEKISLNQKEDIELENKRLDIEDKNSPSLSNTKLNINDSRNIDLESEKISLNQKEDIELENKRLDIEDKNKNSLETTRLIISDQKEPNLETTRLDIVDESSPSLSETKLNISDQRKTELSTAKVDIIDSRKPKLEETKIEVKDTRKIDLSENKLNTPGEINEVEELYESALGLEDSRKTELETKRVDIKIPENINLDTTKVDIKDSRTTKLDNTKVDLEDNRKPELETARVDINDSRDTTLSDKKLDLDVEEKPDSLDFTKIDKVSSFGEVEYGEASDLGQDIEDGIQSTNPHSVISGLSDSRIDLLGVEEKPDSLEDTRLDIKTPEDVELEDTIIKEPQEVNPDLSTFIDEIEDTSENKLEDKKLEIKDTRDVSLSEEKLKIEDERENKLSDTILPGKGEIEEVEELYDSALSLQEEPNEVEELYDSALGLEDTRDPELEDTVIEGPEENEVSLSTLLKQLDLSDVSDAELYTELIQLLASKGENGYQEGWEEKLASLMSAYLSGDNKISPDKAVEYEAKLYETLDTRLKIQEKESKEIEEEFSNVSKEMPGYKLPEVHWGKIGITGSLGVTSNGADALNVSNYLRGTAELAVSGLHGNLRRILLEETLAALVLAREAVEKLAKANRERLPGDDYGLISDVVSGGVSGAIKSAAKSVISTVTGYSRADMKDPINRPNRTVGTGKIETKGFNAANSRISESDEKAAKKSVFAKILLSLKKAAIGKLGNGEKGITFKDQYLNGEGVKTTIKELCLADEGSISTVEELKNILISGPYITTPKKFGTITSGLYGSQTLDTNSYWEIILEPYVSSKGCSNGGFSFLPSINEINTINSKEHGVHTAYSSWIPFTGFELQKSKLTTKSVGLYDGEIVFPVSSEYTNELRLTIADDQFKSWRNYFQKVADVSVYASSPHDENYYTKEDPTPTAVDKSSICIALYKNVAFNIKIYVMTPQFSTIKKFNLLCVLKDFSEEYSGEVDSGGTDLSVGFSIVGELNGIGHESALLEKMKENAVKDLKKLQDTQDEKAESLMGLLNNCIGLLG